MLGWAVVFLIIALVAAVFGFGGIAAASAGIVWGQTNAYQTIAIINLTADLREPTVEGGDAHDGAAGERQGTGGVHAAVHHSCRPAGANHFAHAHPTGMM